MNLAKTVNSSFILNEKINIYGITKIIIIKYNKKIIESKKRNIVESLSENLVNSNSLLIKKNFILTIEFIIWQKYIGHLGNFAQIMNSID